MPRIAVSLALLGLLALVGCAEPAGPGPTPLTEAAMAPARDPALRPVLVFDQEQVALHEDLIPLALYPLDPDPATFDPFKQNLAQTFTPSRDVRLEYLYMPIACATGVLARIQVRETDANGLPVGPVLWDRSYDPGKFFADGEFIGFQIYGGLHLSGGAVYALVLSSNPTGATQETTCSIIRAPGGDLYEGGTGFQNQPGFPDNYWVPLFLPPDETNDLPFRTLVRR